MRRTLAAACALAVTLVVAAVPTQAATKHSTTTLCVGGGGCYSTIQAAVDAAHDGDTIKLNAGTFAGGVQITKSLNLTGAGSDRTFIRGGGPVLLLGTWNAVSQPAAISINGVTVMGGINRSSPDPVVALGGGIAVPDAQGPDGPLPGASVTIVGSVIRDNRVQPSGTTDFGIQCPAGVDCPGAFAGGGGIESHGNLTLIDSVVRDNHAVTDTAYAGGGGIRQIWGNLTLRHSIVSGNESVATPPHGIWPWGGGIIVDGGNGAITIVDSQITDNRTSLTTTYPAGVDTRATGTALDFDESHVGPVTITNTRITGNSVTASGPTANLSVGDIFYVNATSPLTMRDSIFAGNSVTATGASIFCGCPFEIDSAGVVTNTQIVGNRQSLTSLAGDVFGIGTFVGFSAAGVRLVDSVVADNKFDVSATGGQATLGGAGIWNAGTLQLNGTRVTGNIGRATGPSGTVQGGGIWNGLYADGGPPSAVLTLTDSLVARNSVSGSPGLTVQGGGLFTAFPVTLQHSAIVRNTPDQCYGC